MFTFSGAFIAGFDTASILVMHNFPSFAPNSIVASVPAIRDSTEFPAGVFYVARFNGDVRMPHQVRRTRECDIELLSRFC